jgi:hypothetical protein
MSKTAAASCARAHQLKSWYTLAERCVIDPFKTQYLEVMSASERKQIVQYEILPNIFNYWHSTGVIIEHHQEQMQVLLISNIFLTYQKSIY